MVAPPKTRRIVCQVYTASDNSRLRDGSGAYKPSTLVPWADPYIAGLVRRLQSEVRFARASAAPSASSPRGATATWPRESPVTVRRLVGAPHADLEPPLPDFDSDGDGWDAPRWSDEGLTD